jgi:hypothetical protein
MVEQPVTYDLGDTVTLGVEIFNAAGNLANAGAVSLSLILPDGTTVSPLVTNPSTGKYAASLTATQVGVYVERWTATGANAAAFRNTFTVRDDALIPVVSLENLKLYLSINSDDSDEELRAFLDVASQHGEAFTGRVFGRRTVVAEFTRPSGSVTFPRAPILSVASVVDDGDTLSADEFLAWKASGVIEPVGAWQGDLTVTAVCGYAATPAPLQQGIMEMTRHLWQTQRGTLRMGIGQDDWSPAMSFSLPRRVAELWEPYRLPGFG